MANNFYRFSLFFFFISSAWANPSHLKIGECFTFTQAAPDPKIQYIVGRVERFNFRTMSLEGTLYAKKNDNRLNSFARFPFTLRYTQQTTVEKQSCPSSLPKMPKSD